MSHLLIDELLPIVLSSSEAPVDPGTLTSILQQLVRYEIEEGGPYAVIPGGTYDEIDVGMNIAIALFLARYDVHLPKLDTFIESALQEKVTSYSSVIDPSVVDVMVKRYREGQKNFESDNDPLQSVSSEEHALLEKIRAVMKTRCADVSDIFSRNAFRAVDKTIAGNPDKQMSLMAYYMREGLGMRGNQFSDDMIASLGVANVFFWTAFIIYDDFWDEDEAAEPHLLPVANLFARHYTDFFLEFSSEDPAFRIFFHTIMDKLDAANEWEMTQCRMKREGDQLVVPDILPDYGTYEVKFYPAAGHILGPVSMLVRLGYSVNDLEVKNLIEYFKHYLIAMQLNDDMHDWKEDLARGHISCAVVAILTQWKEKYPDRMVISLVNDMPELERLFWFAVLAPLCRAVLTHAEQSRKALYATAVFEDHAPLEQFIIRNERIARKALSEQEMSAELVRAAAV